MPRSPPAATPCQLPGDPREKGGITFRPPPGEKIKGATEAQKWDREASLLGHALREKKLLAIANFLATIG